MAGAKLTSRQKMINLMYLIFIAMLALNMSKEVLSAFGSMNERLTESNEAATTRNTAFMDGLAAKAAEQPAKYKPLKDKADQISSLSDGFNSYLEEIKSKMTASLDDPQDYEIMDRPDFLDKEFFTGETLKPEGQRFLDEIAKFRDGVVKVLSDDSKFNDISNDVKKKFSTEPVTDRDGNVRPWLIYHYREFPLVASLTKMTQLQADIKTTHRRITAIQQIQ